MSKSIYEVIVASIDENGKVPYSVEKLPDDTVFFSGFPFGFAGGAFEGIMPSGKSTKKSEIRKSDRILKVIHRFACNLSERNREAMCKVLKERYSMSYLQPVMEGVRIPKEKLSAFYDRIREIVLSSPDRNVVKYCLYFMSLGPIEKDKDIVTTLAKHDEFTLHAIRAVLMGFKEPNEVIFGIARHVDGWGKISAVEYLEPETDEIRHWLLRFGCANNIMDNYLAAICAEKGRLSEAIQAPQIDRELFSGAGIILKALIEDTGPAESIEDYKDGVLVIQLYLKHSAKMSEQIDDMLTVSAVYDMLRRDSAISDAMTAKGWNSDVIDSCMSACKGILSDPKWLELTWEYVKSDDRVKNFKGRAAARKLSIDIWDYIFGRLLEIPSDDIHHEKDACYFELADTNDPVRFQKLVDFAESHLPLEEIACGPGNDMGLGSEYNNHACLDTMLQNLRNRPGVGPKLIEAGLWSKVVRNRNLALSALETWDRQSYSTSMLSRLEALKKCEPDKKVKKRVLALLDSGKK